MDWVLKKFDELSVHELYAILRLRNEVFAVEQNCVYPDLDDKDQASQHLMGMKYGALLAYTRILPPHLAYDNPSIGRVVSSPAARRTGIGKLLMNQSIKACESLYGKKDITIGAQLYLKKFYSDFGFEPVGDVYLEDGIEHIKMTRKYPS
jgi:ElaA protein